MTHADPHVKPADPAHAALRVLAVGAAVAIGFAAVAGQLVRLAARGQAEITVAVTAPISESYSRPAILDRDGRVLAVDILLPSITADPARILNVEETIDELRTVLPNLDTVSLRKRLMNRKSRFTWVERKVSTATAERIHNLGLPGISYRWETKRTYPAGHTAGHVLGAVNGDNRGVDGLERYLDTEVGLRMARDEDGADPRPPLRTTLRLGVQHAVEAELTRAIADFGASAAAAVVLDAGTGEIAASVSLPAVDPAFPEQWISDGPIDRASAGVYELGSVFKIVTAAMGMESGGLSPTSLVAANEPVTIGRKVIVDRPALKSPIPLQEVFVRSSNVGAARIALAVGAGEQQRFLSQIGLLGPMTVETGPLAVPKRPDPWGTASTVTIAYGHGIAVSPLQLTATVASLVNGGFRVRPTFIAGRTLPEAARTRVVSAETSAGLRRMMRANVAGPVGTGLAADVPGYDVGGKTGTADRSTSDGVYDGADVITTFLGAFPMSEPRYVVLVSLFDPDAKDGRKRTAANNAAPVAGRVIERIAPMLGVLPR